MSAKNVDDGWAKVDSCGRTGRYYYYARERMTETAERESIAIGGSQIGSCCVGVEM